MNAKVVAIISGLLWTLIAAFLFQSRNPVVYWACLAGPAIGLAVYYLSRWSYKKTLGVRILWAIVSLYLATGAYGLALAAMDLFRRSHNPDEALQAFYFLPLGIWMVLSRNPWLWPLFALSFVTHWVVARSEKQAA